MKFYQKIIISLLKILDHNPPHSTKITIFNSELKLCSRCLGAYISGLICWFIFGYIHLYTNITFSFTSILLFSYLLALPTGLDVVTVDILHIREGNNKLRIFLGVLLGISVMAYFWLLPKSWWFKLITLFIYAVIGLIVAFIAEIVERKNAKTQNN